MLDTLLNNFSTLIITVRRNALSSVMTTLMIISIIVAWSARGNIEEWLRKNPTAEEQSERIFRSVESDKKIESALRADMVQINADRVLIRRYSDEIESATVIPYVTTTHIVTSAGVSAPSNKIISMPRSYVSDLTDVIYADPKSPVCVHLLTKDVKQQFYRTALAESGVYEQYVCPITGLDGAPIGILMAGYLTESKPRPEVEVIYTTLSDTAVRVAGYLDEVTAPEREVWWRKALSL